MKKLLLYSLSVCLVIFLNTESYSRDLISVYSFHFLFSGTTFNVKDYGAKADGKTNDAPAINKAIETAAKAGGGTVFFPAGTYLSGSIRLQNNITLYLSTGCILQAIYDTTAYDKPEPNEWDQYQDYGHSHWHNGFIWEKIWRILESSVQD